MLFLGRCAARSHTDQCLAVNHPSPAPGGSEAKSKFVHLNPASNFSPFNKFHFCPEGKSFYVAGGWVGGLAEDPPTNPG